MDENDRREPGGPPPEPGRMRFQDEDTTAREPTLAERRARERARRAEEAERLAGERDARRRRRVLVGAGVTVGVVALIAVGYAAAQPEDEVVARCVDEETGVVVDDANCATPASGGYYGGGVHPIFIGTGGRQYHYTYGGSGEAGQRATGGTTVRPPEGSRVTTPSGRTISRGGFGVSGGTGSGGS
ncbi:MAG TPA: hypothetical protein VM367_05690 [Pseudonocardia sp.]|nr:hypothetical protein [Pseudonocardia sp.]